MSVDTATVKRVARLARIEVSAAEIDTMTGELNSILGFVEQLSEVDVDGVEPMTAVVATKMRLRADVVTDGGAPAVVVGNAPAEDENFFIVPKVVE
jgi:aspartyl-tRNA(Asn)/glutamyl-tRNA(Gln) amidotransferase subunit C